MVVRHHVQPRKALFKPRVAEAVALDLSPHRLTLMRPLGSEAAPDELWDTGGAKHKRDQLWTGATYLAANGHTERSAMAAVKKIRDKLNAKKAARKHAFYTLNPKALTLSSKTPNPSTSSLPPRLTLPLPPPRNRGF